MIKKTIKYRDFNDREVTRDYYFHLSKVDMTELSLDGIEERVRRAAATGDNAAIFREFKQLISMSVGVRSEDGAEFSRPEAFRDQFLSSPAFDELIMELFTSEDQGTGFIAALLPRDMQKKMEEELAKKTTTVDPFADEPEWMKKRVAPTPAQFAAATPEQQRFAFNLAFQNQKND
jgi:hypothetical protein